MKSEHSGSNGSEKKKWNPYQHYKGKAFDIKIKPKPTPLKPEIRQKAKANLDGIRGDLTPEQLAIFNQVMEGQNFAVLGSAGTGKTFLLTSILLGLRAAGKQGLTCAMTGVVAEMIETNLMGLDLDPVTTLNKGIGFISDYPDLTPLELYCLIEPKGNFSRFQAKKMNFLRTMDYLVIDEISMLSAHLFNTLDYLFRYLRGSEVMPFGGLQIIVMGDFFQLPPVAKKNLQLDPSRRPVPETTIAIDNSFGRPNRELAPDAYIFDAPTFYETFETHGRIKLLTKLMRQKDVRFQQFLEAVRYGRMSEEDREYLQGFMHKPDRDDWKEPMTVFCYKNDVDAYNLQRLNEINPSDTDIRTFKATHHGTPGNPIVHPMVPSVIQLKVGAPVMFLKNMEYAMNGTQGKVTSFTKQGLPVVMLYKDRTEVTVDIKGFYVKDKESPDFFQLPLMLGFANTVHKLQGRTIEKVVCDFQRAPFAPGQFYVAVSRATSPEGLFITGIDPDSIRANDKVIEFYNSLV